MTFMQCQDWVFKNQHKIQEDARRNEPNAVKLSNTARQLGSMVSNYNLALLFLKTASDIRKKYEPGWEDSSPPQISEKPKKNVDIRIEFVQSEIDALQSHVEEAPDPDDPSLEPTRILLDAYFKELESLKE